MSPDWKGELTRIFNGLRAQPESQQLWEALYRHTWPYLCAHNYRNLKSNRSLAQEVTQDVFLGVIKQFGQKQYFFRQFETAEGFCNYLLVASRHRIIDQHRLSANREVSVQGLELYPSASPTPEELSVSSDLQRNLLAALSQHDQEIVRLLLKGHRINEIIKMKANKWTPAYVYTRISRMHRKFANLDAKPKSRKDTERD